MNSLTSKCLVLLVLVCAAECGRGGGYSGWRQLGMRDAADMRGGGYSGWRQLGMRDAADIRHFLQQRGSRAQCLAACWNTATACYDSCDVGSPSSNDLGTCQDACDGALEICSDTCNGK